MTSTDAATRSGTRGRRLGRASAYAVVVAVILVGAGFLIRGTWDPLQDADESIIRWSTDITRPREGLRSFLTAWQQLSQPINLYVLGSLLCLWVWLAKGMRTRAWWAFGTMMVAWLLGLLAKLVVQRARPVLEDPVSQAPGYSFPSGHALNGAAWATVVVILLWPLVRPRASRIVLVAAAVLFVLITALDRIFLGVHYPSDVTVGVLTGTGLALASYAGYRGWNPPGPAEPEDPDLDGGAGNTDCGTSSPDRTETTTDSTEATTNRTDATTTGPAVTKEI